MSDYFADRSHIARKAHTCEWCGETIEQGEKYIYCTGIYYGDFYAYKLHQECRKAMSREMSEGEYEIEFEPHSYRRGMTYIETDRARQAEREGLS